MLICAAGEKKKITKQTPYALILDIERADVSY